ncbi:MAG: hypothetical protein AAFR12_21810 [Cyanobacteria bacterium J06626_6]
MLGSLRDKLSQNGEIDSLSFTIAAWFRYLNGLDEQGRALPIDDPMAETLMEKAQSSKDDPTKLLEVKALFGDLSGSDRFTAAVAQHLRRLYTLGTRESLEN